MSRRKAETDVKERGIEVQAARRDKGSRERERKQKRMGLTVDRHLSGR